jgi:Subtilase family
VARPRRKKGAMPERPLLKLPDPIPFEPKAGPQARANVVKPTRARQQERLAPRFDRLMQVVGDPQALLELRNDPASIAPERAIVFEVAGQLADFYAQARALGFDYLGDFEDEFEPSADFYDSKKREKEIAGRIYLAMPDVRALRELLSLWQRYRDGRRMPDGRGAWRELFSLLVAVRPWGPQDRVPPETISFWQSALQSDPDTPVRFEIEIWYYESPDRRARAYRQIEEEVAALGGGIVHHAVIPDIRYDAALVDIPSDQIRRLIDHPDVTLARVDEIMFLRPQAIAQRLSKDEPEGEDGDAIPAEAALAERAPVAALLDGLPIQNHVRLAGRLVIDDPDDLEPTYPIDRREHGTAMASLIIHGDLNRVEPPLTRPLFVLPVMQPNEHGFERTPPDRLLVDVIYRAVKRIKEGDGDQPASAPGVTLINLSLADEWRPFARVMSPLARLLDYLAYRYRVLFLVSAGNVMDRLTLPDFNTSQEFEDAPAEDREKAILAALNNNKSQRTLFSPAEAINVLTIGAAHSGSAFDGALPASLVDPFTDEELPNIASAMGLGYRKTVKPELLLEGGRTPVRIVGFGGSVTIQPVRAPARLFGAKVAFPDRRGGTRFEDFTWGTSVATALATRAAHRIHDVLMDTDGGSNHADIPPEYMALVLKALLVHGANWGPKGAMLDGFFGPQGQGQHLARRDDIARLLGYGVPKIDRVLDCAENRATLLGVGTIAPDSALLYCIPLPADLDGIRAVRTLTVTLAWLSPINSRHQGYRMAALDVSPGSEDKYWMVSDRDPYQPTDKAIARGTIFHERRLGEKAAVFVDDGQLMLRISCRAGAGDLQEVVPYAMAISFEVGIESGIQVYNEIRTRLTAPVRAAVDAGP